VSDLDELKAQADADVAGADSADALEAVRLKYLARKDGRLTLVLHSLPTLPPDQRKEVGRRANEVKVGLEQALADRRKTLEDRRLTDALAGASRADLTLPGTPRPAGRLHPLTRVMDDITGVFRRLGFSLAQGPEVEDDHHNFTALNHPPDHPARDAHDTFYLKDYRDETGPLLLRTHTSPVQIRYMKARKPPVYIVAPGRVFRHEAVDATHSFVFHQVEGLAVDADLGLADLKGVLTEFAKALFGGKASVRFKPTFFPFVEPGVQVDVSCAFCDGKGCRVCKQTGWIELLGAGMVHPNVLRAAGYDPKKWQGYAFGVGVERVAMVKYGVDDMRHFFENDVRFLGQF
jgi:phenylalanyl-tRNA synthetase alpha chain